MLFDASTISPICCRIFGIDVYWYGVSYAISLFVVLILVKRWGKSVSPPIDKKIFDSFVPWICFSIVVGGRLGHVLFFEPYILAEGVLSVINIRNGGMSFHGAFILSIFVTIIFCKRHNVRILSFFDIIVSGVPIGLFFGRLANFVNNELYGKPTEVVWGVLFRGGGKLPRHPTQIYEALGEGLLTFIILKFCGKYEFFKKRPGLITAMFLINYAFFRIVIDFFKASPLFNGLTKGQWLSLIMLVLGGILFASLSVSKTVGKGRAV